MSHTPVSLLNELRQSPNEGAWQRFVDLYTPPLFRLGRRWGLTLDDATDLVQDVFCILAVKLPTWDYDAKRSFTAWLTTVARNKCRDRLRRLHRLPPHVPLTANQEGPA